jgi:O-antigen/teichoic acid export membrane protein
MRSTPSTASRPEPAAVQINAPVHPETLTSGRLLAGNAVWNLLGTCAPVLVAVGCLPVLKRVLGTDRLGIITMAWVVIGYFGLFDFGISRALTKLVAEKLGRKQSHEIPSLIWTSIFLMGGIGVVGAAIAFALSPWLVERFIKVPVNLQHESLYAFYWVSAAIPIVVVTAGLRGVLEAVQQFRIATAIRVPMGIFTYLGPVAVLPFSHSLVPILATLVIGRVLACIAHFWVCVRTVPALKNRCTLQRSMVGPLFQFGSWMTVSNVISPLMVTFDRFVIGWYISVAAVAFYAVPSEIVTKLWFLPAALLGVLFPAFSTAHVSDRSRAVTLFDSGVKFIFVAMFPAMLLLIAFAHQGLQLWLGRDFAEHSTVVVQYLAAAVFINSVGQVPFVHLQSIGRPDITAKLHLLELPFYATMLLLLVRHMGIQGAAVAWTIRIIVDTLLLYVISSRISPENNFVRTRLPLMMVGAVAAFIIAAWPMHMTPKVSIVALVLMVFLVFSWRWILSPRERFLMRSQLRGGHAAH